MKRTTPTLASLLFPLALAGCSAETLEPPEALERVEGADDSDTPNEIVTADAIAAIQPDGDWVALPSLKGVSDATRVALMVTLSEGLDEMPVMQARGKRADGTLTEWVELETPWSEDNRAVMRADFDEAIEAPELRVATDTADTIEDLTWTALVPPTSEEEADDGVDLSESGSVEQGLSSTLANIGVRSRAAWGARSAVCSSSESDKYRMAIHHTAGVAVNSDAVIRQIQSFHINGRGWCDIAYHFLVGTDGTLWEGRPVTKSGGHTRNNNSGNIGICYLGCFQPGGACAGINSPSSPTNTSIEVGARLVATLSSMFGIPRNSTYIKGHREHSGQTTSCPGNNLLARIGDLRTGYSIPPPPPPASCFDDVGGSWAEADICALKDLGLTHGCGDGSSYCPASDVTRAEMAVFLDRLHTLLNGAAAPVVSTPFVDISGHWAATSIKRIYGLGITVGVDATHYGPQEPVTRAQMAAFLSRIYRVLAGHSAPVVTTPFVDIAGHWAETPIKQIYGLGITHGVSPTQYGPQENVTRAQMAAFLVRTHNVCD